jgi:hypothetical protein
MCRWNDIQGRQLPADIRLPSLPDADLDAGPDPGDLRGMRVVSIRGFALLPSSPRMHVGAAQDSAVG